MSRVLQLGCGHEFNTRLNVLLGKEVHLVTGRFLAFGPGAVLERLRMVDRPDAALLGPYLSSSRTETLSNGLVRLYPNVRVVHVGRKRAEKEYGGSNMNVRAMLSRNTETAGRSEAFTGVSGWLEHPHVKQPTLQPGPVLGADMSDHADIALDLEDALDFEPEVETVAAQDGLRSHIIAVVAPKGGLGKTTVSTNLAVGLAKLAPKSVVLLDADMQFGDVATALSLAPTYSLPDMVTGAPANDVMVLKTYLTAHQSGFYTVCGSDVPSDGDRVTGDQLSHLIVQLSEVFRFVIVDTAPGLGEHALSALELATDAVFLCDMSVPSARGLRKELAVLNSIGMMPSARHVVLNLAERKSGLSVRDIEATIGVPVDVAIPRSSLVAVSTNKGTPLLQDGGRSAASKALYSLVHRFEPSALMKRGHLHRRVDIA